VWRGAALADAAPLCPVLAGEAARLEEARLAVVEERVGCDLALGRHGEVVGELAGLVARFPLRERPAALLMTALYRCGRRGEALAVFDAARRVLADELGLDPGPELAALQAQVLADDPALAAPAPAAGGAVALSAAAAVAAQAAAVGVVPRQLPAGAAFFTGREAELKELDALLGQAGLGNGGDGEGGPVVISAVAGMAGVGKTALAVHWARTVAGRFPDGQLYVNLRGYDPEATAGHPAGGGRVVPGRAGGARRSDTRRGCRAVRVVPQLAGRAAGADRFGQRPGRIPGAAADAREPGVPGGGDQPVRAGRAGRRGGGAPAAAGPADRDGGGAAAGGAAGR